MKADAEMMRTFNMGVGLILVVSRSHWAKTCELIRRRGHNCYALGEIGQGSGEVRFVGQIKW